MTRGGGLSLSGWLLEHGTRLHAEELAIHRSGYQLKEADPHTWAIPRLTGRAKAAMVKIQADRVWRRRGRRDARVAVRRRDAVRSGSIRPTARMSTSSQAVTLATTNLISLCGLHRRLRGALVGHLASFEMNSVGPMARYGAWLKALGVPAEGRRFYDVHVLADEVHQHIAVDDLVHGFLESEPGQADEVLFGAQAIALVEQAFAAHVVDAWTHNRSSLWHQHRVETMSPGQRPVFGRY